MFVLLTISVVVFLLTVLATANDESLRGSINSKLAYDRPAWCEGDGGLGSPCGLTCKCRDDTAEGPLSCSSGNEFYYTSIPNGCFHSPRRLKEPCSAANRCADGFSCGSDFFCYHSPRLEGEPCVVGECADGFVCQAQYDDRLTFACVKKD